MFSWEEAKEIMKFAFPLVPGLLLIGLWHPLSRSFISKFYSVETVGLLSFAVRITSVMAILNSAIQLAWKPLLFENLHKDSFKNDVVSISRIVVFATLYTSVILSLFFLQKYVCILEQKNIMTVQYSLVFFVFNKFY